MHFVRVSIFSVYFLLFIVFASDYHPQKGCAFFLIVFIDEMTIGCEDITQVRAVGTHTGP